MNVTADQVHGHDTTESRYNVSTDSSIRSWPWLSTLRQVFSKPTYQKGGSQTWMKACIQPLREIGHQTEKNIKSHHYQRPMRTTSHVLQNKAATAH